jgi:acid phosphatase
MGRLKLILAATALTLGAGTASAALPHPDHVVIVIMENKSFAQIIGNVAAPNINALATEGANIVNTAGDPNALTSGSHALRHPSQPNYLELFSGNHQGVVSDGRPGTASEPGSAALPFSTPNLAAALLAAGFTFATYSEGLAAVGFDGDASSSVPGQNQYERKHNPAVNWQAADAPANNHLPPEINRSFTQFPQDPGGYATLPTVAFVVPDEQHNMHDGSVAQGDAWLKTNILDGYYQWAKTHNSLLIITFDEDATNTPTNQITTIFAGALVRPGNFPETNINPPDARPPDGGVITPTGTAMNHHNLLRTIEEMFGLAPLGGSANTPPVTDVFRTANISMLNNSTRLQTGAGNDVLIGGFIIAGQTPKRTVVRGLGPSLQINGVPIPGTLSDPVIELHRSDGALAAANNDWKDTQAIEIQATGLAPRDDREAAIVALLDPGAYSVVLSGRNNGTGIGLVEAYDIDQTSPARLLNLAARGRVQTQNNVMIGGVILAGADYARVVFRGLGPSIPIPDRLSDPVLELHDGNGATIGTNDNWKQTQGAEIQASGLSPANDAEAAIIGNFAPGQYTVILRGKDGTSGIGLVEAYKLN